MPPRRPEAQVDADNMVEVLEARFEDKMRRLIEEATPKRHPRTDWTRSMQLLIGMISVAAFIFAIGSWKGKNEIVETRLTNVEIAVQQLIKQQADQKTDSAVMLQKIDQVVNKVSEISGQMQQRPVGNGR